jgi:hypothetical protein
VYRNGITVTDERHVQVNVDIRTTRVRIAGLKGKTLEVDVKRTIEKKLYHGRWDKRLDNKEMLTSSMNRSGTEQRSSREDLSRQAARSIWGHLPMDPPVVHHIRPLHSEERPRY